MRYPVDIEVLADEYEEQQQVLKELAMEEVRCEQCGHHDVDKIPGYRKLVECMKCGHVWELYPTNYSHGIPEEAWEYGDYMRDRGR